MDQNLLDLIQSLQPTQLAGFLEQKGFAVKTLPNNIFSISYRPGTERWERWARECRGAVVRFVEASWQFVKYPLNRTAEIPLVASDWTCSSPSLSRLSRLLCDPTAILQEHSSSKVVHTTYLSMKVDGMLLTVTRVSMRDQSLIPVSGINKLFYDLAIEMQLDFYVLFSSIKSFELTDPMSLKYVVSALIISSGLPITALGKNPLENLEAPGRIFLERLNKLPFDDCSTSYYFEAHCHSSTGECCDLWGERHPELMIVSKESCGLYLLGRSLNNHDVAHHTEFIEEIIESGFQQPWTWRVESTADVHQICTDLEKLIIGEMDQDAFLTSHPPFYFPATTCSLDYEGFVLITPEESCKIKTRAYYQITNTSKHYHEIYALASSGRFARANRFADFIQELDKHLDELTNIFGKLDLIPGVTASPQAVFDLLYHLDPFIVPAYQALLPESRFSFLIENSKYFVDQCILFLTHHYPKLTRKLEKGERRERIISLISSLPLAPGLSDEKIDFYNLFIEVGQQRGRKNLANKPVIVHQGAVIVLVGSAQELASDIDTSYLAAQLKRIGITKSPLVRSTESTCFGIPFHDDYLVYQVIQSDAKEFHGSPVLHWELSQRGIKCCPASPPTINHLMIELTNRLFQTQAQASEPFPLSPRARSKHLRFLQNLLDEVSVSEPRNVRSCKDLLDWESASEPRNVRSCKDLLDWESASEPRNARFDQIPSYLITAMARILIMERKENVEWNEAALQQWILDNPFDPVEEYRRVSQSGLWEGLEWRSVFVDPSSALAVMPTPSLETEDDQLLIFMEKVVETGIDHVKLFRSTHTRTIEFKYVICLPGENPIKNPPPIRFVFDLSSPTVGIFYLFWSPTGEPRYYSRMAMC